jgi:hypothetical protein
LDTQVIRILILSITRAPAGSVDVQAIGKVEGNQCCIRYTITIATQVGSQVDVDGTATTMKNGLTASGDFIVEGEEGPNGTNPNSAAQFGLSLVFLLLSIYTLF